MCKRFFALLLCLNAYGLCFSQVVTNIFGDTILACSVTPQLDSSLRNCVTTPPFLAYAEQSCFAPIDRLLARSICMMRLSEMIRLPEPGCIPAGQTPQQVNPLYNVDDYVANIRMLVEMKASFVLWAGHRWGNDVWLTDYSNFCGFPESIRQTVCDINAAFDCDSLRRPIIQGCMYEHVDGPIYTLDTVYVPDTMIVVDTSTAGIDYVRIPEAVIEAFRNDPAITGDTVLRNYYFYPNNRPNDTLFFHFFNIVIPGTETPDVTRIEGRMWFYYEAAFLIDAGYTAIHMGDISQWGKNDFSDDKEYDQTWNLLRKIRQYANDKGSFVLLNSEANPGRSTQVTVNGQEHLLFDFNTIPFHFREMTDPPTGGDPCDYGNQPGCVADYASEDSVFFNTSSCSAITMPAIIDTCLMNHYQNHSAGLAPNPYFQDTAASHCTYGDGEVPTLMYFDLGNGMDAWFPDPNAGVDTLDPTGPPLCGDDGSTYGLDDTNWFALLPDDCKVAFFEYYQCRMRAVTNGHTSFPIPGLLIVNTFTTLGLDTTNQFVFNSPEADTINQLWRLVDYPAVQDGIDNIMNPPASAPAIGHSFQCGQFLQYSKMCHNVSPPGKDHEFSLFERTEILSLKNSNCTSVYTWHIKDLNGNWLPFQRGSTVNFAVPEPGIYEVSLRVDNTALNNIGSIEYSFLYTMDPICCEVDFLHFRYACDTIKNEKEYYSVDFSIPSEKSYDLITVENTQNNLTDIVIDYATNSIKGTFKSTFTQQLEKDTFDTKVIASATGSKTDTFPVFEIIERCSELKKRNALAETRRQVYQPFNVYPNPAANRATIEYLIDRNDTAEYTVKIVSTTGAVQKQIGIPKTEQSIQLDLSAFASGIYTVLLCKNGITQADQRLIISN